MSRPGSKASSKGLARTPSRESLRQTHSRPGSVAASGAGSKPVSRSGSLTGLEITGSRPASRADTPGRAGSPVVTSHGSRPTSGAKKTSRPPSGLARSSAVKSGSRVSTPGSRGGTPGGSRAATPSLVKVAPTELDEEEPARISEPLFAPQDTDFVFDVPPVTANEPAADEENVAGVPAESAISLPGMTEPEPVSALPPVEEPSANLALTAYEPINYENGPDDYDDDLDLDAPGAEEEEDVLAAGDDEGGNDVAAEREPSDDGEELVVLDPDHPLMRRFQSALKQQLAEMETKLELDNREIEESLKKKKKEKDDLGVELYNLQQELARLQSLLEDCHDRFADTEQRRVKEEQTLDNVRGAYKNLHCQHSDEKKKSSNLISQVENLSLKLFYMRNAKTDVRSDIAVMKRVAEKAEADAGKVEIEKQEQDVFMDRLVERVDKLREEIAMAEAEIAAQAEESSAAKQALRDAADEIEAIMVEKRQLMSLWNSSLIGMERRNKGHAAMVKALDDQSKEILSAETEIDAYKKSIGKEQEQNEKLTLIAKKTENEIITVRKQIANCDARMEALQKQYSVTARIIQETERNLAEANRAKTNLQLQVNDLQKEIERSNLERIKLNDEIIEVLREKQTTDKASQYAKHTMQQLRERSRNLEQQIEETQNRIAEKSHELEILAGDKVILKQSAGELDKEIEQQNAVITKSENEIRKRINLIEQKQNAIKLYNEKLDALISKSGGEELGPLEMTIKSLRRSIIDKSDETTKLQQRWLRQQTDLVHYSTDREKKSKAVADMKRQIMIATQRKLRVEHEIDAFQRSIGKLERSIDSLHKEITYLDTMIFKETGNREHLERDTRLLENDFVLELKEREMDSFELQDKLNATRKEKERILNDLIEAERQIMLWEKKTQIAKETRAAVDSDIGQGEMKAMKAEIHRMQVRLSQLLRQQEKLCTEMVTTVSRRDTIVTRGEAAAKKDKDAVTRANFHRQLNEKKRSIRRIMQEIERDEGGIEELAGTQQGLSQALDERQTGLRSLQNDVEVLEGDLELLLDKRQQSMSELMSRQQKNKHLTSVKDGKYKLLVKEPANLQTEMERHVDELHAIHSVVERINSEAPQLAPIMRNLTASLRARVDTCSPTATQR